ncbi:MAG: hypothetical protein GXY43_06645 [Clostridiaceae bacterium]|jgi:predicted AAA+ superfamily ATPase|nr:hypothetical protein [Clostridiaceae bacterium]
MVLRTKDLEWLKEWRGNEAVKIFAGVRRCGKSTLLLHRNLLGNMLEK